MPEAAEAINAFLSKMREGLGARGRPNVATRWYAKRQHDDSFLRAPWCNMRVTWAAFHSGTHGAVCFGTDFAYTVAHAEAFRQRGRWTYGTDGIRSGDVIFFQWEGGRRSIRLIDHVGVVEKVLSGGRVQTIEGNTSDALLRKVRSGSTISGYGRPDWNRSGNLMVSLQKGDSGPLVLALQKDLLKVGQKLPKWGADGDFGDETVAAVKAFQESAGFTSKDGVVRPKTRAALDKALKALKT
jgi:hypothetical protein